MTVQPENRFRCDRCGAVECVVIQNTPQRPALPAGWMHLLIEDRHLHLCIDCAIAFEELMHNEVAK